MLAALGLDIAAYDPDAPPRFPAFYAPTTSERWQGTDPLGSVIASQNAAYQLYAGLHHPNLAFTYRANKLSSALRFMPASENPDIRPEGKNRVRLLLAVIGHLEDFGSFVTVNLLDSSSDPSIYTYDHDFQDVPVYQGPLSRWLKRVKPRRKKKSRR